MNSSSTSEDLPVFSCLQSSIDWLKNHDFGVTPDNPKAITVRWP